MEKKLIGVLALVMVSYATISCKNQEKENKISSNTTAYGNNLIKLSEAVKNDSLITFQNIESIPNFILHFLESIRNEKIEIGSFTKKWAGTDIKSDGLVDTNISNLGKQILNTFSDSGTIKRDSGVIRITVPNKKLLVFSMGRETAFISFFKVDLWRRLIFMYSVLEESK